MFIPTSSQRQSRKAVINFGSPQNLPEMSGTSNGAKIEVVGKICQKEQRIEIGSVFVELGCFAEHKKDVIQWVTCSSQLF